MIFRRPAPDLTIERERRKPAWRDAVWHAPSGRCWARARDSWSLALSNSSDGLRPIVNRRRVIVQAMHASELSPIWWPWIQAGGAVVGGIVGFAAGWRCSQFPSRWWWSGYLVPLVAILLCGAAFRHRPLELVAPFSWLTAGHREYFVLAAGGAMVLGALLPRLRFRRERALMSVLVATLVLVEAAWPLLAPAFRRRALAELITRFDADDICLQNTDHTCGPAATVTALRALGLVADEGELAILFGTTASTGTPADIVADRLNARFGRAQLRATHRAFRSAGELIGRAPALAWVRFDFLTDHVVAVLDATTNHVVLGDPFRGRRVLTPAEFEQEWRWVAVTLERDRVAATGSP